MNNLFVKIRKNILQPIKYLFQAKFNYMKKIRVSLGDSDDTKVMEWYQYMMTPHPYFKWITSKSIAMAVIDISELHNFDAYKTKYKSKNYGGFFLRKHRLAIKKSYTFSSFNRAEHIDELFEINTSTNFRQGKKMTEKYQKKNIDVTQEKHVEYYGVFDKEGKLKAYIHLLFLDEAVFIFKLLGHYNLLNDGIMYLMITKAIELIFSKRENEYPNLKYIIYDSFFTNSKGLKLFKKRFGFIPTHINWHINNK